MTWFLLSNLTYVNFGILGSKIKNKKHMSPKFSGKYRKTHVLYFYHFSLPSMSSCILSPNISKHEAIETISLPRLSGNYLTKRCFLVFDAYFWEMLEDKHQLRRCFKKTSAFSKVERVDN